MPAVVVEKKSKEKSPKGLASSLTSDDELRSIVENIRTSIKIVGTGGAGCHTISRLLELGVKGGDLIAVNTDALDLLYTNAPTKVLIGASITGGIGAGNDPELGAQCAEADAKKFEDVLQGADMAFVTCGLGGGTGTGSAPIIAQVARDVGALTVGVVTLPFSVEGVVRAKNALMGLKKLRKASDTVIVIPNDKLLQIAPNFPLNEAFKVCDEVLANAIKGVTEMITTPGIVNVDFADLKTVLKDGGTALIGLGRSSKETSVEGRARESVERALNSPLLDVNIATATSALINITGNRDMTLEEAERIVRTVSERISPEAEIIWGAQVDESLERNVIKTLLVLAGVGTPNFEEELEEKISKSQGQGFEVKEV